MQKEIFCVIILDNEKTRLHDVLVIFEEDADDMEYIKDFFTRHFKRFKEEIRKVEKQHEDSIPS